MSAAHENVLVGSETGDDAGVYLLDGTGLVATTDFITPVCDDAVAFGRIAAANSLSDVYAMGGQPILALNICCFPESKASREDLAGILRGGAEAVAESGAALLGGHSVKDEDLKFGLAVVGRVDPNRILSHAKARPGHQLILSKPLGTGVLINAYRLRKLDAQGLAPALTEMQRLNSAACRLAHEHSVESATDITGFGLVGHALGMAKASGVTIRFFSRELPVHEGFEAMLARGVSTMSTPGNILSAAGFYEEKSRLDKSTKELIFDPQTSGGLLMATPANRAESLLAALNDTGHRAAHIGEVLEGRPKIEMV